MSEQFAWTIVSQGHLSPVPLAVTPVRWGVDHCMSIHPLPHMVVVGDRSPSFAHKACDCLVVNPGPFGRDFTFVGFTPADRTAQICGVDI